MNPVTMGRPRLVAVTAVLSMACALVFTPAQKADALSQWCGEPTPGVFGEYASGNPNAHPSGEPDDLNGWGGSEAVGEAATAVFALERAADTAAAALVIASELAGAAGPAGEEAGAIITLTDAIAQTVLNLGVLIAQSVLAEIERRHALIDGCGDVLTADLTDLIFIATIEDELATLDLTSPSDEDGSGVAAGVRNVPSAMFLLPEDGLPAWQDDASLYQSYGDHEDLEIVYQDGLINADHFGIAILVRNQIAHMDHHGMDTGGADGYYDPRLRRHVPAVPGAKDMWLDAMAELQTGDVITAYQEFARAYQTAVTAEGNPA